MNVSVIIPMYNSEDTIKVAVESIINQTYSNPIEILIINDGSTDCSKKIVEDIILENKSNRSIKLINKNNGGVSSARNCGILESKFDWIALLDSDDKWLPSKLEKQIEIITHKPEIKFIGTNRNGEKYPYFNKLNEILYTLKDKQILLKMYPHTSTALIKKDTLLKVGLYDENRTHVEDGDLWLKIAELNDLYVLNEDLVYTGGGKRAFGVSGLSANMKKMYEGELLALEGTKNRKQINFFEFVFFYIWLTSKYIRRIVIKKIKG